MLARLRKSTQENEGGFTLIELLVVMIIIGILAAIAIPAFLTQKKKGYDAGIKSDLRAAADEMESQYTDTQAYPTGPITIRLSTGDVIETAGVAAAGADGFCMRGSNPKSTAVGGATPGKFYWYDSKLGGLQSAPTATNPSGACTGLTAFQTAVNG